MRQRKSKTFYATRGLLQGEGKSKTEAKADLDRRISFACNVGSMHVEAFHGLAIIVAASCGAWEYTLLDQSHLAEHGKRRFVTCSMGTDMAFTDALNHARNHAAQWVWNHDIADDAAFVASCRLLPTSAKDLASWIKFQRTYQASRAQGLTDCQAFNVAAGLPQDHPRV